MIAVAVVMKAEALGGRRIAVGTTSPLAHLPSTFEGLWQLGEEAIASLSREEPGYKYRQGAFLETFARRAS